MKIIITGIRATATKDFPECELRDITFGKQYKVKFGGMGSASPGEAYIKDDKGDKNWCLGQLGIAEFYIVDEDMS